MKLLAATILLFSYAINFAQIEIELSFFDQFENKVKKIPYEVFDFNDGKIKSSNNSIVYTNFAGKIRVFPKGYPYYTGYDNQILIDIPPTKKYSDTIVLNEVLSQRALIKSFATSQRKTIYDVEGNRICDLDKVNEKIVKTTYYVGTELKKKEEYLDTDVSFTTSKIYYENGIIQKEIISAGNKETVKFYDNNGKLTKYYVDKNSDYAKKRKIYNADGKLIEKTTIQSLTPSIYYGGN